ncbi:MAG: alpha/beta hydrolase [Phenylobacterium sp.]
MFHRLTGQNEAAYFLFVPSEVQPGAPIMVSVHGVNRNAAEHAFRFREEAARRGAVLIAPLFEKEYYGGYQQLVCRNGARSDEALLRIVDSVSRSTHADGEKVHLFGYSGGAQFAHRFAMLHPERIKVAVVGAAGWYTYPDQSLAYPAGLGESEALPGLNFRPEAAAAANYVVVVGERDVKRGSALRQSDDLDASQGADRVERGRRWIEAMGRLQAELQAPGTAEFIVAPGLGHSFRKLANRRRRRNVIFDALALTPVQAEERSAEGALG